MKINRKELLVALELVGKIPTYKGSLPVFDNVYLSLMGSNLHVVCSDYEIRVDIPVPASRGANERAWDCLVNRKLIIQTIKAMYEEELEITLTDSYGLNIKGMEAKIQLPGNPASGYPELKWGNSNSQVLYGLTHQRLSRFIQQGRNFVASDELRPVMNGLYLYKNDDREVGACATDAHRLYHGYEKTTDGTPWNFILPKGAFNLLEACIKKNSALTVQKSGRMVWFSFGRIQVYVMGIDGNFPNFLNVIPKREQFEAFWEVNKSDLLRAINLAAVTENKATSLIRFSAGEQLLVRSQDMDYNLESEQVVKIKKDGKDVEIGLKSKFLKELLKSINTQIVKFSIVDSTRSVIIEPETEQGFLTLLMPMMINH